MYIQEWYSVIILVQERNSVLLLVQERYSVPERISDNNIYVILDSLMSIVQ